MTATNLLWCLCIASAQVFSEGIAADVLFGREVSIELDDGSFWKVQPSVTFGEGRLRLPYVRSVQKDCTPNTGRFMIMQSPIFSDMVVIKSLYFGEFLSR